MRILFFLIPLIFISEGITAQSMPVVVKINFKRPYCGGARPTKQILEEAEKLRPYINKIVIIVSDNGKVDSVKTSKSGVFKARLKQGSYKLLESWRYYQCTPGGEASNNYLDSCLRKEWQKEIKTVTVKKRVVKIISGNEIIEYCPWSMPCFKDENRPPLPE